MKPRCFFIATSWDERPISRQFRALSSELVTRGHRVVLLISGQKYDVEAQSGNPAIWIWPSKRPVKFHDAMFLVGLIRKYRPDCLISNFAATNVMMLVGQVLNVSARVDWYHTVSAAINLDGRVSLKKIKFLRLRKRFVYRAATNIVAVSEAAREDLHQVFQVPKHKCHVFFNSIADPLKEVDLSCKERQQNTLICAGRLEECKGQDVLIRAISHSKHILPDLHVRFLGDGPSKARLLQLAEELGVADRCIFAGTVSHHEVLREMAIAVATVVPSRNEAFGLVNIESLAMGTPVIASAVGGIVEIIRDGEDGFLVPADNPAALSEKLIALISNHNLREKMSANARDHFVAQFTQNKSVMKQADWLERIII